MGLLRELNKIRGGWPGGWKQYARGYGSADATPPFVQPTDPDDRRSLIPATGLKEYWYPALPAKDVGRTKPVGLKLLDQEIVLFRDKHGEVQALWDYCPHRGAYLSWGNCFWKGSISCPYHGATFDGEGECIEFITEGPDSKMVGRLQAKRYPTVTLKGIVFVWMGQGEPVEPREDLPPELFEGKETVVGTTFRYWDCNWMIALENTSDAHNCFFVHRNALRVMFSARGDLGGRPRTPLGYRTRLVNEKAAIVFDNQSTASYYAEQNGGKLPYKMYYPRVGGHWPLGSWRLLWVRPLQSWARLRGRPTGVARLNQQSRRDANQAYPESVPEDWRGGMRLPGMQRLGALYTRWCVPVDADLTRTVYFRFRRSRSALGRFWHQTTFKLIFEFLNNFNFSDQDYDAMRSCRWQYPEYLSATDSHVVAERRLVAEHARGLPRRVDVDAMTSAEKLVVEAHALLGARAEDDYGQLARR